MFQKLRSNKKLERNIYSFIVPSSLRKAKFWQSYTSDFEISWIERDISFFLVLSFAYFGRLSPPTCKENSYTGCVHKK